MTFGSLVLFVIMIYLVVIVSRSVISNYNSNKDIEKDAVKLTLLQENIHELQNQINYYQTYSFREKEARAKLGYIAAGEKIISLPIDTLEDKVADSGTVPVAIAIPNQELWWQYFFGKK